MVDSEGMILCAIVTAASVTDRKGACAMIGQLDEKQFPRMEEFVCDAGYRGEEVSTKAYVEGQWAVRIVTRRDDQGGFEVQPIRWIVERTFAWLMKCRRLTADVEKTVSSATGMIYLAMISLMLRRLEPAS